VKDQSCRPRPGLALLRFISIFLKAELRWVVLFVACLLLLFYPGWLNSQIPAFRDGYHFYYPQAVWLDACAQQGEYFPQWNSTEGLGSSVAGQPTAAIYYPLRWIWLLPGLNIPQRYALFIMLHLVLAAWGIHRAAKQLGLSSSFCDLPAVACALSCPIFFQHTNLVYLTSAAWIGWMLSSMLQIVDPRQPLSIAMPFRLFLPSSLMFLGGDPHTAANAGLLCCLAIAMRLSGKARGSSVNQAQAAHEVSSATPVRSAFAISFPLAAMATALLALSVCQFLPALRWSAHSQRVINPATSERLADEPLGTILASQTIPPHNIYDFSISPGNFGSLAWPTWGGYYLPVNSRWLSLLPSEARMWVPSLYFGTFPLLLFLSSLRWRGTDRRTKFLILLTLGSMLAAMGNYSLIWLVYEGLSVCGYSDWASHLPPAHVGSLYGLLAEWIPGYASFRYPGKWSVWFIAGASLLAGQRLQAMQLSDRSQLQCIVLSRTYLFLSFLGLLGASFIWLMMQTNLAAEFSLLAKPINWISSRPPDRWQGPPQLSAIATGLWWAFFFPCCGLTVYFVARTRPERPWKSWLRSPAGLTWLSALELTCVAFFWLDFVPAPTPSKYAQTATDSSSSFLTVRTERVHWANTARANATLDVLNRPQARNSEFGLPLALAQYQQTFELGKLGLLWEHSSLHASQSLDPLAVAQLRSWLALHDTLQPQQPQVDEVLRALGVSHRLVREPAVSDQPLFAWQAVEGCSPLCTLETPSPSDPAPQRSVPDRGTQPEKTLSWRWSDSSTLLIQLNSRRASTLVIRQFHDGGWQLSDLHGQTYQPIPQQLFLTFPLPAGTHELRLRRRLLW
jgi:hypothetical protein